MIAVPRSGQDQGPSELANNQTTRKWLCHGAWFLLRVEGTFDSGTITLESCPTQDGTYVTHVADDPTGTPADQTFTENMHRCYIAKGVFFRAALSGAGGSGEVNVYIEGPAVALIDE